MQTWSLTGATDGLDCVLSLCVMSLYVIDYIPPLPRTGTSLRTLKERAHMSYTGGQILPLGRGTDMAITKNWRPPKASSQTSLLSCTFSLPFPHFSFVLLYFNSASVVSFLFIFSLLPSFSSCHLSLPHSFPCYPSAFLYIFLILSISFFSLSPEAIGFSPRKLEEAMRYPAVR